MKYQKYDYDAFHIYTIKTDKFKSCHMEIIFRNNIEKENITNRAMLAEMLGYNSMKYPKRKDVVIALEELYNASFYSVLSRTGNTVFLNFIFEFLSPSYCDENVLDEFLSFPLEMILNPSIQDDEFNKKAFEIAKNRIQADIDSMKDSPKSYAIKKAYETMDPSSPAAISLNGYEEDLALLTPSKLVKSYHKMLEEDVCDIYLIGDLDMDYAAEYIAKVFSLRYVKKKEPTLKIEVSSKKKPIVKKEEGPTTQSQLIMLYTYPAYDSKKDATALLLFNQIFGAGSSGNKLMQHLREENSLCYSVNSMTQGYEKVLMVYAGIDKKNYDKAVKLVKASLAEMQRGDFSEEVISKCKELLLSGLKTAQSNSSSLLNNYLFHNIAEALLLEDRAEKIMAVTKDDIIRIAKMMELNTIYLYHGKES